ncbi:hypothetical protein [Streptomyces sp. NPDC002788]
MPVVRPRRCPKPLAHRPFRNAFRADEATGVGHDRSLIHPVRCQFFLVLFG